MLDGFCKCATHAVFAALVFVPMAPVRGSSTNLALNPGFEQVGPGGPSTTFTGIYQGGPAAAAWWTVFNNTRGMIATELVPSTLPIGGVWMLHVVVDGNDNGIVQTFIEPEKTGPWRTESAAWVYVVKGAVTMGTGDGGDIIRPGILSHQKGVWEYLEGPNEVSPSNEIIFYSVDDDGAEFYIDNVSVIVPEIAGDVDRDGLVTICDVARILRSAVSGSPIGNRSFTVRDAVDALRMVGGLGE